MRTPTLLIERLKLSLFLIAYTLLGEWVDPRPFASSTQAKILYVLLVAEILRQTWTWTLEWSPASTTRTRNLKTWIQAHTDHIDTNLKYRLRRLTFILTGLYAFGWVIDGMTTRCTGALQCAIIFPRILVENIPTILQVAVYIAIGMAQLFAMFYAMTKVGAFKVIPPGTINVTFDDVYGQDQAKARVMEQIELLEDSDLVEAAGGYMPKGILLWGPPGTGKTMLAKAAANASSKPLIFVPPGAFASTFVGINFLKVWQLFRAIRKYSLRYGGSIVFIDEIDALGNRGAPVADQAVVYGCVPALTVDPVIVTGGGGMNMGTLEAFLAAMDGMDTPRGVINKILTVLGFKPLPAPKYKYLMIGATNLPSKLDAALTRAGRFERKIHVPYPDREGRLQTLTGYLGKVTSHTLTVDEVERFARDLYRGTGAEIEAIVNESILVSFRRGGDGTVTRDDMLNAMLWREFGESDGRQEVDEDSWKVAVHEAGHAVAVLVLMPEYQRIRFGTVEKRGNALGMIVSAEVADRPVRDRDALLGSIAVSLASKAAEELIFGASTTGVGGDLRNASATASRMVAAWGMGKSLQSFHLNGDVRSKEVEKVLRQGWELAQRTVAEHRDGVLAVAELLDAEGTVLGSDILEAWENRP